MSSSVLPWQRLECITSSLKVRSGRQGGREAETICVVPDRRPLIAGVIAGWGAVSKLGLRFVPVHCDLVLNKGCRHAGGVDDWVEFHISAVQEGETRLVDATLPATMVSPATMANLQSRQRRGTQYRGQWPSASQDASDRSSSISLALQVSLNGRQSKSQNQSKPRFRAGRRARNSWPPGR
jgi:hypothetical protein